MLTIATAASTVLTKTTAPDGAAVQSGTVPSSAVLKTATVELCALVEGRQSPDAEMGRGGSSEPAGALPHLQGDAWGGEVAAPVETYAHDQEEEQEADGEDELLYQATQMLARSSRPAAESSGDDDEWGQGSDDDGREV